MRKMDQMMNKARLMPILIVIAIGIVLGGLILTLEKPSAVPAETAVAGADNKTGERQPDIGPKGGKLFTSDR